METCWNQFMLGKFAITRDDRVLAVPVSRKARSVLAYISYFSNQSHPRDEIAERLWSDLPVNEGLRALAGILKTFRDMAVEVSGSSGPSSTSIYPLIVTRDYVCVRGEEIDSDVRLFLDLVDRAKYVVDPLNRRNVLLCAAQIYNGPLLPGLRDEWVNTERDLLAIVVQRVLQEIVDIYESQHRLDDALEHALRAVAMFPESERAHERTIELYIQSGRRADAIRQYLRLNNAVWRTTGNEPSTRIADIVERIGCTR